MSSSKKKLLSKASTVSASLDQLEALLEPLFSQTLPETTASLDTLQQAKLQVALPYLINDLVFICLRTRGVDPKTHPVVAELDRIRRYFEKIKNAEDQQSRRTGVDKAAASRFIKHALAQAQRDTIVESANESSSVQSQAQEDAPIRVTEKMREREKYLKGLKERGPEDSEEEEPLAVFDDGGQVYENIDTANHRPGKDANVDTKEPNTSAHKKRRKLPMDPFAAGEEASVVQSEATGEGTPHKKSKKITSLAENAKETPSSSRASSEFAAVSEQNSTRKRKKKKLSKGQ